MLLIIWLSAWQERGKNWQLLVIGCFFVLVRIFAICIAVEPQSFLLHAANGGLMQILWQWRTSLQPEGNDANNVPLEDGCSSEVQITRSDWSNGCSIPKFLYTKSTLLNGNIGLYIWMIYISVLLLHPTIERGRSLPCKTTDNFSLSFSYNQLRD